MARLTQYLESLPQGSTVSLVGFTDNDGAFDANRRLSVSRAKKVAADLNSTSGERLSHLKFLTDGFGEMSPVACNSTSAGKALNRRVEVWVLASN